MLMKMKNETGKWCSMPDKDNKRECIPFSDYLKMTEEQKKYFNRERRKD